MMPERAARVPPVRPATAWIERQALFIAALGSGAAVILGQVPRHLNQDGWLGLVAGREVAERGIPDVERLTVWSKGADWIDQQWLSQLSMYELYVIGGLALVTIAYVAVSLGALALALGAARSLGADERHVIWVLPLAAFLYIAASLEIRTQGIAYPLFVATLWLLAADREGERRRTLWVLAVLVLWGNTHGTVVLGVALTGIHGLLVLLRRRRPMGALLAVGAPLCLLVSPYGLDGIEYYRDTILDTDFRSVIAEWQPITYNWLLAAPYFALAFGWAWILGAARNRVHLFDKLAIALLATAAITAIRNVSWFALASLVLLPQALGPVFGRRPPAPRNERVNLALAGLGALVLTVAVIAVAAQPSSWFQRYYDQRTPGVVARLAAEDPQASIYADEHFADWLLWREPSLAGRIAYDARFELLTSERLDQLSRFTSYRGLRFADATRGFSIIVLDPEGKPLPSRALLRLDTTSVRFRGEKVIVATRRSPEMGT